MSKEILSLIKELNKIAADLVKSKVDFNVLTALRIEHREVYMCRLIGGLLAYSPIIRKLFGQIVLQNETDDFENATVILEEVIDEQRRVDIVIKTDKHIYPIEAKIYAGDQEAQLCDYWKYYTETDAEHFVNGKIYYLTPTGKEPSPGSRQHLTEEIIKISFAEQIAQWLAAVEKNDLCNEVKYVVKEFQEVVEKMNQSEQVLDTLFPEDSFINIPGVGVLFNNQTEILRKIKEIYIYECFENSKINSMFQLDYIKSADDSRELFDVLRNGEKIAKLCVDTNLYIYVEDATRIKNKSKWHKDGNWSYIYRNNVKKEINLKEFWKMSPPIEKTDIFTNLKDLLEDLK